ncbi:hypothetical protein [Paracoccus sp. (in: a-proteobacteria)]|uniref:calcium-binding protein n=1 Tax=Paracoccus sp. TaxID=267 RepID=UPI00321FF561
MPTNSNDIINSTDRSEQILGLNGADEFHWTPGGHDTFIGGDLGEAYDVNIYLDKTGGDRLFVGGNRGVKLNFENTEDGLVTSGEHSLKFSGMERIHLTDGNDTVRAGAATLRGAHGDTPEHGLTIYTGAGNDDVVGTRYDDYIDGGIGNDTIRAGSGNDHIQSSTGNDLVYGGAGIDNIRWGLGDSTWHDPGNDTIYGGGGQDVINAWGWTGGNGDGARGVTTNITAVGTDGSFSGVSRVDTGARIAELKFFGFELGWNHLANDTVDGSGAQVSGSNGISWNTRWGDDVLIGTAGNDTLEGGEGRDTITGGAGNDLISANGDFWNPNGAQADAEVDTIVLRAGFGHDTVLAFGDNDILDTGGMRYTATENARGTLLTFSTGDTLLLNNVFDFM